MHQEAPKRPDREPPHEREEDRRNGTVPSEEQRAELRNRTLARGAVAAAEDVLLERYRLASPQEAFALLRAASQRHNVKLHTLADAVVRVPGPAPGAQVWFPGRARNVPPPLPWRIDGDGQVKLPAVLRGALHRVLEITGTDMGNVQLAEGGVLRMAAHTGLDRQFTDYFAFVEGPTTSCAHAARERRQVTVREVGTEELFDEDSRRVILRAGSRACHSVPLVSPLGALVGMVSSHHSRPLAGPSPGQLGALQETGTAVGRWLSWYRRTTVLDALEHLHAGATGAPAPERPAPGR
ncbi:ANTAR domain-containing protein [Streptomyces sp. NPDC005955]|uniref:ANTAR domain-containing protein n=1 Tax=Streptomyces sp. NPDC005955 TaxID=3364738 RepID=UPI0036944A6B